MSRSLGCLVLLVGCQEYNLSQGVPPIGEANPPDLVTPIAVDRIVQVTEPSAGILWVIDNSCSMEDEQRDLSNNFPVFMDYFLGSGLDYHIGVVSTDMDAHSQSGKLVDVNGTLWIDPDTNTPSDVFTAMASLGTNGSATEAGIAAAYTALEVEGANGAANDGFLRKDASCHVVVISDEEDQSGTDPISKLEFIDYLLGLKDEEGMVTFSSIVSQVNGGLSGQTRGDRYMSVTDAVGGITWDIDTKDWQEVLEQLGIQAAGLKREYFLAELPVPGTIEVSVVDAQGVEFEFDAEQDWTYSATRNSITFIEYLPPPLAEVTITYQRLSALEQ